MKKRGFTLIEILVVVGLIMFLAAFVIVAAVRFGNNSRKNATRALIQRVGLGLNKYYGEYRVYPAEVDMHMGNMSIYDFLHPHMEIKAGDIRQLDGKTWLCDAWGNRIIYISNEAGQTAGGMTDSELAIMRAQVGQYRVRSPGPNGIDKDDDDITLSNASY